MPACQIGCCPVDSCECSIALNDCECLFTNELDGSLVLENSYLTAEHHFEKLRLTTLHTICSCRTKDELTDYLKPVVPYLDDDNTDAADIDCQTDEDGNISYDNTDNVSYVSYCCDQITSYKPHESHKKVVFVLI